MDGELVSKADRIHALKLKAQNPIEVWQPTPGETLAGELVGSRSAQGLYGETYQIIIRDELGALKAAWLTKWLKESLKAQGASVGSLIAITFLGKKQNKHGANYNSWSILVEGCDEQANPE